MGLAWQPAIELNLFPVNSPKPQLGPTLIRFVRALYQMNRTSGIQLCHFLSSVSRIPEILSGAVRLTKRVLGETPEAIRSQGFVTLKGPLLYQASCASCIVFLARRLIPNGL